jgi:hypothetical protein
MRRRESTCGGEMGCETESKRSPAGTKCHPPTPIQSDVTSERADRRKAERTFRHPRIAVKRECR